MGKNIISQARGKGGPTYRAPSFRYKGAALHKGITAELVSGKIIDFIKCAGHSAPLMHVRYDDDEESLMLAPEGVSVGSTIYIGEGTETKTGNILELKNISEGTSVFNIEIQPGDGGKFARTAGSNATIVAKTGNKVIVQLPSKKQKTFHNMCRAMVGTLAGGGRLEKPLLKAGHSYYKHKAKNKLWPKVSGCAQNAVDHPFGNKRSSRNSKARPTSKNAPPGRKVGAVGARRTGQSKTRSRT